MQKIYIFAELNMNYCKKRRKKQVIMKKFLLMSFLLFAGSIAAQTSIDGQLINVKRLTIDSGRFENPQWSPDGTKIAFTNYGYNNLYVMDADGGNCKKVSSDNGVGFGFEWSSDSREVIAADLRYVLENGRKVRKQALWSYSISGEKRKLSDDVTRMNQAARVKCAKYRGLRGNKVSRISFSCEPKGLYSVNGIGEKTLINEGPSFCPSLSPDGKRVVFNHGNNVCVMNIDGTGKRVLDRGFNPVWVNGRQIVYEQTQDDGHTYTSGELYVINIDGSGKKALTSTSDRIEMCPSISPDGKKIVFCSFSDGQIYSADLK